MGVVRLSIIAALAVVTTGGLAWDAFEARRARAQLQKTVDEAALAAVCALAGSVGGSLEERRAGAIAAARSQLGSEAPLLAEVSATDARVRLSLLGERPLVLGAFPSAPGAVAVSTIAFYQAPTQGSASKAMNRLALDRPAAEHPCRGLS